MGFKKKVVEKDEQKEGFFLPTDIYEKDHTLYVVMPLAGVDIADVQVGVDGDILTIRGERNYEHSVEDEDYYTCECFWGDFQRSIVLPESVIAHDVTASMKKGILTVKLPIDRDEEEDDDDIERIRV